MSARDSRDGNERREHDCTDDGALEEQAAHASTLPVPGTRDAKRRKSLTVRAK
jgi:hypothetical protein